MRTLLAFALSGLAALALVALVSLLLARRIGDDESVREARTFTQLLATGVVEPNLEPGVAAGDPRALARLDSVVRSRVLEPPVVRVKLWDRDGNIVYSDERRLI